MNIDDEEPSIEMTPAMQAAIESLKNTAQSISESMQPVREILSKPLLKPLDMPRLTTGGIVGFDIDKMFKEADELQQAWTPISFQELNENIVKAIEKASKDSSKKGWSFWITTATLVVSTAALLVAIFK